MSIRVLLATSFALAGLLSAQETAPAPPAYTLDMGTTVPLSLINSISTKHSAEGDRVYLETVFPLLANGRIVVPVGSYVAGTVTQIKKPGRVKGRGELYVRFDTLTLPNGVTRDFHGRIGSMDGNAKDELDRTEGKVRSEGNKAGDARTVGEAGAAGLAEYRVAFQSQGMTAEKWIGPTVESQIDELAQAGGKRRGMPQLRTHLFVTTGSDDDQLRAKFDAAPNRIVGCRVAGVQGNQRIDRWQFCRLDCARHEFKVVRTDSGREYVGGRHQIRACLHADNLRGNPPQTME